MFLTSFAGRGVIHSHPLCFACIEIGVLYFLPILGQKSQSCGGVHGTMPCMHFFGVGDPGSGLNYQLFVTYFFPIFVRRPRNLAGFTLPRGTAAECFLFSGLGIHDFLFVTSETCSERCFSDPSLSLCCVLFICLEVTVSPNPLQDSIPGLFASIPTQSVLSLSVC